MPGWVSNGPVQINVGRDLHKHGGGRGYVEMPDDCVAPRASVGPGLGFALMRVLTVVWTLATVLARLAAVLLAVVAWVTFTALALSVWLLGRIGDLLRGAEAVCGGAPTQLVYVPSFMSRDNALPMLGPGARVNELADNTRESHYVE
jgi:hypothetical protein